MMSDIEVLELYIKNTFSGDLSEYEFNDSIKSVFDKYNLITYVSEDNYSVNLIDLRLVLSKLKKQLRREEKLKNLLS